MYSDGEGVRTLVALSGCPLKCEYCINKEIIKKNQYQEVSPNELLDYIMIDYCYFIATKGGVTFGGGEPLLQYKAIKEFKNILPKEIDIVVETSLNISLENLKEVINDIDFFIIDIKTLNEKIYKSYTNKDIDFLINNLKFIQNQNLQDKCMIRIPKISNYTTNIDIKETISKIKEMGFNNLDIFDYQI